MPKPTGLVGSIRDICDPAAHHFQSVPRLRARLEDFEEIWQFDCLRRGAALVVPGAKGARNSGQICAKSNQTPQSRPGNSGPSSALLSVAYAQSTQATSIQRSL